MKPGRNEIRSEIQLRSLSYQNASKISGEIEIMQMHRKWIKNRVTPSQSLLEERSDFASTNDEHSSLFSGFIKNIQSYTPWSNKLIIVPCFREISRERRSKMLGRRIVTKHRNSTVFINKVPRVNGESIVSRWFPFPRSHSSFPTFRWLLGVNEIMIDEWIGLNSVLGWSENNSNN